MAAQLACLENDEQPCEARLEGLVRLVGGVEKQNNVWQLRNRRAISTSEVPSEQ